MDDERKELFCDVCGKDKYVDGIVDAYFEDFGCPTPDYGFYHDYQPVCPKCGNKSLEDVNYARLNIDWEITEVVDILSIYDEAVSLCGLDDSGNEYTANAVKSCGEIVDIEDIERIK